MGFEPLGMGRPSAPKITLRFGGGSVPSARGFGGRPRRFLPVSGSTRTSISVKDTDTSKSVNLKYRSKFRGIKNKKIGFTKLELIA